ncbi:MAG: hypothetical protein ACFFEF_05980 [Candidatus Thorarchaeota archaeon]
MSKMDNLHRFAVIFLVFIVAAIPLIVLYVTYLSPGVPDILTLSGVIVVLGLILVFNLLPKRHTGDIDSPETQ